MTQERRLDRVRRLAATGAAAGVDLEDAEAAVALARSKRDVALAEVNATKAGGSQILVGEAQLEAARAQLQSAEARLAQTRITAPSDGTVLRRDVEPGDAVQPGHTLLVLAGARNSERELEIVVEPDEKQLAVLAKGQKASCAADAFPDAPFEATVRDIAPLVDAGRGTVEVRLSVAQPPPFLRADMTVSVEVVTGTKEKALVVPRDAVRDLASAEPWVLTLAGDRAEKRPVKLGSRGTDVVEVLDGVSGGTTIITDARLKPGARVKPL
jgi:HlyD family secretion protein